MQCPRCQADITRPDEACSGCGTVAKVSIRPARSVDRRAFVLTLVLGCLAGFGIPLLWSSRGLSTREKVLWSVVALVETVLIFALVYLAATSVIAAIDSI